LPKYAHVPSAIAREIWQSAELHASRTSTIKELSGEGPRDGTLRMAIEKVIKQRTEAYCEGIAASTRKRCRQLAQVGSILCNLHGGPTNNTKRYIAPRDVPVILNDLESAIEAWGEEKTRALRAAAGIFVAFLDFAEAMQEMGELEEPLSDRTMIAHLMACGGSIFLDISNFRRLRAALKGSTPLTVEEKP
jgi:hypothetical protein